VDHQLIARALLAAFCGLQGAATVAIDLNRTHATHLGWLGHARFHVVWQTANMVVLSLIEIGLIGFRGPWVSHRFYTAAILAGAPVVAFFVALFARKIYGGTLSDPKGMLPWTVGMRGRKYRIDLNVVAEIAASLLLAAIVALYRAA
jgi:hypothetical protein